MFPSKLCHIRCPFNCNRDFCWFKHTSNSTDASSQTDYIKIQQEITENNSVSQPKRKSVATPTITAKAPRVEANIYTEIPRNVRQKALDGFYTHFLRIYKNLVNCDELAAIDATRQEMYLFSKSSKATYQTLRMGIHRRLLSRPVSNGPTDVGIDSEWKPPEVGPSAIDLELPIENLLLSTEMLDKLGYPLYPKTVQIGTRFECDRCGNSFKLLDNTETSCRFHWHRMKKEAVDGKNTRLWRCCQQPTGAVGCDIGPHVFKEESVDLLHSRIPFIELQGTGAPLVALDCEMCYTDIGMELIRLTMVNHEHHVIIDELVLPLGTVLDLNSRWSGVQSLDNCTKNLQDIHEIIREKCGKNTIFVGHGLENDLKALRIIHHRIIDTCALFPHPVGLPYRFSLQQLCKDHLGKFIQDSTSGHDSKEDAITCLELLAKKLKQ